MKKFSFKLQRLLDMREAKEKEIQNELAAVVSIQNAERARQEELLRNMDRLSENIRKQWAEGRFDSRTALFYGGYEDRARKAIEASEKKIAGLEPEAQEIRKRLVRAFIDKKIVEKLKEKKREEYGYELKRKTFAESDDINQKLYQRNIGGGYDK